jgi:hypothetical protein
LVEFNKAIDAYSTNESDCEPRKVLTGQELFAIMAELKDDQQYIMCYLGATVGARPSDTGRLLRKFYTWCQTGEEVTDGHYARLCKFSKNFRKQGERKSTPPILYEWIWPMTKRAENILRQMCDDEWIVKDSDKTYSGAYSALPRIARRLYPESKGNINPMDYRRHFINTIEQHVPPGQVHLYSLHANEDTVRAHYVVFNRGNEGILAEDNSEAARGDHPVPVVGRRLAFE